MFIVAVIIIFIFFTAIIFIGAPYLPTLKAQQQEALKLLDLKKGDTVLDLGSGDGRFLLLAAKNGYKAVGIEANPVLVLISYFVCFSERRNIKIIWANMWSSDWPKVAGVYVFLHTKYMSKLDEAIKNNYSENGVKVVSYAFEIPNKKYEKARSGLYLYKY
jgi:SAM-dependent methyltransferase